MAKIIVLQHVAYEILGTFNAQLKQAGIRIKYVNFERHPHAQPSIQGYDGLVILGGPMCANDVNDYPHLDTELTLIKQALHQDLPTLGICLGAQLLAKATGATVQRNTGKEIGWHDIHPTTACADDPILHHLQHTQPIFQWHGDSFTLPKDAVHLASSDTCPNQAFRLAQHVYGFQFHLEVDEHLIERWLNVPAHQDDLAMLHDKDGAAHIRDRTTREMARNKELSRQIFGEFIALLGHQDEPVRLRSR